MDEIGALPDSSVIQRSVNNPSVFETIRRRHEHSISQFARRRVGPQMASDITSEVFVRAFENREKYDLSRPHCRPWLYGIAHNVLRQEIRVEARYRIANDTSHGARVEAEYQHFEDADSRVEAERLSPLLLGLVAELKVSERNILWLFAVEQSSYAEIARVMCIPIGTVRSRLSRTKSKLSSQLLVNSAALSTQVARRHQGGEGDP